MAASVPSLNTQDATLLQPSSSQGTLVPSGFNTPTGQDGEDSVRAAASVGNGGGGAADGGSGGEAGAVPGAVPVSHGQSDPSLPSEARPLASKKYHVPEGEELIGDGLEGSLGQRVVDEVTAAQDGHFLGDSDGLHVSRSMGHVDLSTMPSTLKPDADNHSHAFRLSWRFFAEINGRAVVVVTLLCPVIWYILFVVHGVIKLRTDTGTIAPMYNIFEPPMDSRAYYDTMEKSPTYSYLIKYTSGLVATMMASIGVPLLIARTTFGWTVVKGRILNVAIGLFLFLLGYWIILFQLYFGKAIFIRSPLSIVPNVLSFVGFNIYIGFELARLTRKRIFRWAFSLPQLVLVVLAFIYFTVLPPIWVAVGPLERAIIRLVVHPIIFEIAFIVGRICVRRYPFIRSNRCFFPMVPIQILSSFFGRFLLVTMGSLTATIITTLLLSLQELLFRFTAPQRDYLVYRLMRNKVGDVKSLLRTERSVQLRCQLICSEIFVENSSILISTLYVIFGYIVLSNGDTLSPAEVIVSFLVQLASEVIVDYICVHVELKVFRLPIITVWNQRYKRYLVAMIGYHVVLVYYFWSTSLASLLCTKIGSEPVSLFYCTADDLANAPA